MFQSSLSKDSEQEAIVDILESAMEDIILDLSTSNLGLITLVLTTEYESNDPIEFEEVENLAVLRFNIEVRYRKEITNC